MLQGCWGAQLGCSAPNPFLLPGEAAPAPKPSCSICGEPCCLAGAGAVSFSPSLECACCTTLYLGALGGQCHTWGLGERVASGNHQAASCFPGSGAEGEDFPVSISAESRQSCGFPSINSCCGDRGAAAGCWTCCQGGRGRGCADRCSSKANPPQLSRLSCCPAAKVVPRNGAEIRYPAPLLSTSSQRCRRAWSAQGHPSRAAHAKRKAAPGGSSLSGAPARAR